MSDKDWTPYLRDFKLGIITGDREIKANPESLVKFDKELTFVKDEFPGDIITGSLGLNIFGFLDREISDIDILIKDKKRYSGYNSGEYCLLHRRIPATNNCNYLFSKKEAITSCTPRNTPAR